MTKRNALEIAIEVLEDANENAEAVETLRGMIAQLDKRTPMSEEKKAELKAKRHEATVIARTAFTEQVIPVLLNALAELDKPVTAQELTKYAKDKLPEDCTTPKVQNVLLREMASMVVKTETKGKANTYALPKQA